MSRKSRERRQKNRREAVKAERRQAPPMSRCEFADCARPVHYTCLWRVQKSLGLGYGLSSQACGRKVCYFHGREVDANVAYCPDHWEATHGERLPHVPEWAAAAADENPEAFNPPPAKRKAATA